MSVPLGLTRKCLSGMPRLNEGAISGYRGLGAKEDEELRKLWLLGYLVVCNGSRYVHRSIRY